MGRRKKIPENGAYGPVERPRRVYEYPDPTPIELPVGFKRPESLNDMIRRITKNEMSIAAQEQGQETFEEADTFDVEEDIEEPWGKSPYEMNFDVEEEPAPAPAKDEVKNLKEEEPTPAGAAPPSPTVEPPK